MRIINCTDEDLQMLYDDSAWTWEGMSTEKKNLRAIVQWFKDIGSPLKKEEIYVMTGKQLNNWKVKLSGGNAYRSTFKIMCIKSDNISNYDIAAAKHFEMHAKWFDDVCDNNWRREKEKQLYGMD